MNLFLTLEPGLFFSFSEKVLFHIPEDNPPVPVEKGKIYGIYGANGCGKTSLLNMINGFLCPKKGRVVFYPAEGGKKYYLTGDNFDETLTPLKIANIDFGIRRIFQVPALPDELNLYEALSVVRRSWKNERVSNFLTPLNCLKRLSADTYTKSNDYVEISELLREFNFNDPLIKIGTLSYGERRIVSVLQMIYSKAGLLLLDEPFANVHENVITKLQDRLLNYVSDPVKNRSIILIEHRHENLKGFASQTWHLHDKRININR